ncbi:hypothetical protein [Nocardia sp. NPDC049149]|uniref:hypothetical protein n=1 Tax=Nocardia sp. NPDC049149 TaxID=3364315 RepID=UPI0037221E60
MDAKEIESIAADVTRPTFTDVSIASNAIVAALVDEDVVLSENQAVDIVCDEVGVPVARDGRIEVGNVAVAAAKEQVRTAPMMEYLKQVHATRLAIARLVAQGVIVPTTRSGTDSDHSVTVNYKVRGHGGGARVPVGRVLVPGSFRRTPGLAAAGDLAMLTVERWTDVKPLLNARLLRLLEESLDAARRGSYLSAVTLMGAVLEGAWWKVAEKLCGRDAQLAQIVTAKGQAAPMQVRVAAVLRSANLPAGKASADALLAFAGQVRQVRNYGIHSTMKDDLAAEKFFTEAGSYLLLLQAHSHLVQLLGAGRTLRPRSFRT